MGGPTKSDLGLHKNLELLKVNCGSRPLLFHVLEAWLHYFSATFIVLSVSFRWQPKSYFDFELEIGYIFYLALAVLYLGSLVHSLNNDH